MFGLYMLGLYIIARVISAFIDLKGEKDRRNKARRENDDIWVDRYGTAHHTNNDQPFMLVTDFKTRDIIEKNPYSGEIVRNVTKETKINREKEKRSEAINNGMCLYAFEPHNKEFEHRTDVIKGSRWKDVYTDNIYVPRTFNGTKTLFLNIKTGLFDYYDDLYSSNVIKSEILHIIEKANETQKDLINKYGIDNKSPIWRNELSAIISDNPRCKKEYYV